MIVASARNRLAMSNGHYCDNTICPQHKLADAPGPVDYLNDGNVIRVSRHHIETIQATPADLCGICYSAVKLCCINADQD